MAKLDAHTVIPSVLAGAKAVPKSSSLKNGVAVIDLGRPPPVWRYLKKGDLQYVGVAHLLVVPILRTT